MFYFVPRLLLRVCQRDTFDVIEKYLDAGDLIRLNAALCKGKVPRWFVRARIKDYIRAPNRAALRSTLREEKDYLQFVGPKQLREAFNRKDLVTSNILYVHMARYKPFDAGQYGDPARFHVMLSNCHPWSLPQRSMEEEIAVRSLVLEMLHRPGRHFDWSTQGLVDMIWYPETLQQTPYQMRQIAKLLPKHMMKDFCRYVQREWSG